MQFNGSESELGKNIGGQVIVWNVCSNDGLRLGSLCFRVCPSSYQEGRREFRELCEISATVARDDW